MLFKASNAVTVKLNGIPVVTLVGAVTDKWMATSVTVIGFEVPVIDAIDESVALTVWLPMVMRVTEKVPVPLVNVVAEGSTA